MGRDPIPVVRSTGTAPGTERQGVGSTAAELAADSRVVVRWMQPGPRPGRRETRRRPVSRGGVDGIGEGQRGAWWLPGMCWRMEMEDD